jgi:serine/threonine-protein kinase RsbW
VLEYRAAERNAGLVVIELRGTLIGRLWAQRLQDLLEEHFIDDGVNEIRVDVSLLDAVDDDGITTLSDLVGVAEKRGKRLLVKGAAGVRHRATSESFAAVPRSLAAIRSFVRTQGARGPLARAALEDLVLAVSEACTNAIVHSGTSQVHVTVVNDDPCVHVTVLDEGMYQHRLPTRSALGEGGRGILLMAAVVDEVAIHHGTPDHPGTSVRVVKCEAASAVSHDR